VHVAVTAESLPLSIIVGPGNEHDSRRFFDVVDGIRVGYGVGRPVCRPGEVYADSAYDSRGVRLYLRRRGVRASIPLNPRRGRKLRRGRPYRFDERGYRCLRSAVERFFAWLKSFRRLVVRYERLVSTFIGFVEVACILIYLRVLQ